MCSAKRSQQRALNAAGQRTRAAILESAERVLVDHGHRGLTVRAVASTCGISIGNLHYHFASLDDLIAALVDSVLQRYKLEFERQLSRLTVGSASKFVDLAGWVVLDAAKPEVNRLFRELWALESHHPAVAAAMASLYSDVTHVLAVALRSVFPHISQRRLIQTARLIVMLSEGSGVLGGCDGIARRAPTNDLARLAREAVRLELSRFEADSD